MNLYIRSQDKMALAKFDLCILEKYDDKYMFIADHYKNMGTYATKERALEVLDEIQNILKPRILVRANEDNEKVLLGALRKGITQKVDLEYKELSTYVYEMPEE